MDPELPSPEPLRNQLARLDRSVHLCVPYQSLAEHLAVAAPFIAIGLERRERCFYIQGDVAASALLPAVESLGVDTGTALRSGALQPTPYPEPYIQDGRFDPDRMVQWLERKEAEAREAGFSSVRYAGEMTWALGPHPEVDRLVEYEAKLNPFVRQRRMAVLCQYDRGRFPSEIVREMLATHPTVVARGWVCANPNYIPPERYLSPDWPETEIDWMLECMEHIQRTEDALRESAKRHRVLSQKLLEAQETERRSLALELHDQLGQLLTAIRLALRARRREGQLAETIGLVDQAIDEVRSLALALHPPSLEKLGLPEALRAYLDREAERTGLAIHLAVSPMEGRPPAAVETACFRLVQEALTNVVRHSGARRVDVELHAREAALELSIRDDGKGFDVAAARSRAQAGASLGVLGMEERVALAGGQLEIESSPGRGTIIRARFPLSATLT